MKWGRKQIKKYQWYSREKVCLLHNNETFRDRSISHIQNRKQSKSRSCMCLVQNRLLFTIQ